MRRGPVTDNGRVSSVHSTGPVGEQPAGLPGAEADPAAGDLGPPSNVADLLRAAAGRFPERPAVIGPVGTRSWADLDRAADAGARRLLDLGAGRGERVVIALPTGHDLAAAMFAVARAGLTAVPTAPVGDIAALAERVGAIAAVSVDRDRRLGIAFGGTDLADWWSGDHVRVESVGGGEDLAVLARARGDRAVMLSHRAILAAVAAIGRLGATRLRDGDRVLQVLPMYHLAGWVVSFLPNALVGGAAVIPEVGFDVATIALGVPDGAGSTGDAGGRTATDAALRAAAEHSVTVVPAAPGFYHHMMAADDAQRSLATVRLFTSGTAPLRAEDAAAVRAAFGQPVWEGYGLSESASVVTTALTTPAPTPGSVGRPLSGIEVRVVGPDGQDLIAAAVPAADDHDPLDTMADAPDAGEVGRIVIRGDTLFSGYWSNGAGGPDADGWFVTGDIGFLDDAGELHLVDRASETIVVSGFTVYPREIEDVLGGHPGVAEVAVIGVPAADGHQEVVAVLVAHDDGGPTEDELRDFVDRSLPGFKHPAVYRLVGALPRTDVGRVDRDEVRRRFGPAAQRVLPTLVAVPGPDDPDRSEAEPDVSPEPAGDLAELGTRLPGTGDRVERARDDTDEDLF